MKTISSAFSVLPKKEWATPTLKSFELEDTESGAGWVSREDGYLNS